MNRKSFKQTLNTAKPFRVKARPLHLRPGVHPDSLKKLADEQEIEAYLARRDSVHRKGK